MITSETMHWRKLMLDAYGDNLEVLAREFAGALREGDPAHACACWAGMRALLGEDRGDPGWNMLSMITRAEGRTDADVHQANTVLVRRIYGPRIAEDAVGE